MAQPILMTAFPSLSVEDNVSLTRAPTTTPSELVISLTAGPGVTWWKALEVWGRDGALIGRVETQDADSGPKSLTLQVSSLRAATLVLAKAKIFGIHTAMYELHDLSVQGGFRLDFVWNADTDIAGGLLGFFRDLGNFVQDSADAAAGAVEAIVEAVVEVASTVIEFIGSTVANVLNWVAGGLSSIPFIGGVLAGAVKWVSSVISAFLELKAVLFKGGRDLIGNLVGGAIRIFGGAVGGIFSRDASILVKGITGILSAVLGTVVGVIGKGIALVQAVLFMQMGDRRLTETELALLRNVYRGSVLLYNIRVVDGFAGIFSTNPRAFTLGDRIYMKGTAPGIYPEVLVHECCHVWQYQHRGLRYIGDALFGQVSSSGYSWQSELTAGNLLWQDFNAESQGQFIQDVYRQGEDPFGGGTGSFFNADPISATAVFIDGGDHTDLAVETMAYIRSAWWGIPRP